MMKEITRRQLLQGAGAALALWGMGGAKLLAHEESPENSLLISAEQLQELLSQSPSNLRLIDFRDPSAYLSGHLPQALNVWQTAITVTRDGVPGFVAPPETVNEVFSGLGLDADSQVMVYGDSGSIWAGRLFWVLDYYGHADVHVLDGGFPYWKAQGLPLALGVVEPAAGHFEAVPQPQKLVDADWVLAHLEDPTVVLVDARDAETYAKGHIPGALSKPWRENLNWDTEQFKALDELRARFESDGITPEKTVVSYCQLGVLGAQNYFTLRLLGYPDVRLYDGSFADWTSDASRPVATGA